MHFFEISPKSCSKIQNPNHVILSPDPSEIHRSAAGCTSGAVVGCFESCRLLSNTLSRSFAFSSSEEAAAERRRRKRQLRIELPLHALRRDPNTPRPPRDPNAPACRTPPLPSSALAFPFITACRPSSALESSKPLPPTSAQYCLLQRPNQYPL
ncbi:hypothetical protein KSP39_PZI023505 [Platanthera zijinensis]|uniref:Uncharacterized protein n=1 Tax=Platanthera zijinensis TaxID=2320716 RepID=A0AAP0FTY2_9ASPA